MHILKLHLMCKYVNDIAIAVNTTDLHTISIKGLDQHLFST